MTQKGSHRVSEGGREGVGKRRYANIYSRGAGFPSICINILFERKREKK